MEKVSEAKSLPRSSELSEPCLINGLAYTAFMGFDDSFECSDLILCPTIVDCKVATFIGTLTTGKCYLRGQPWAATEITLVGKKFGTILKVKKKC